MNAPFHPIKKLASFLLLTTLGVLSGCALGSSSYEVKSLPGTTTTFILVRHAEKESNDVASPLSAKGRKRAQALVDEIVPLGVTAIYCPALRRNKETVQPLAERLNLEIRTVAGWRLMNTRRFADDFVQKTLAEHAGGVVLWAGNSSAVGDLGSNLQELYQRLGGQGRGPHAYHDLFVIAVRDNGAINIQKKQYGQLMP